MPSPLFEATSTEKPRLLSISFASDPSASLGAQLTNNNHDTPSEMFNPSYAAIAKLLDGDTIARKCGVRAGDCIVAVNGQGFRRFKPDYDDADLEDLTADLEGASLDDEAKKSKAAVLSGKKAGEAYAAVLGKIKEVKKAADAENPLALSLERYDWDARVNSWPRFLVAREGDVPAAMMMIQEHEAWRDAKFPIDLTKQGLQDVFKAKAVAEVDIEHEDLPPTVYVNFKALQALEADHDPQDVVDAFIVYTETLLSRSEDPRKPKAAQFIDLSGVSISSGLRVDILKQVYAAFEPNYPETLHKMVMYPVSSMVKKTAGMLLSFVNENTQKKFVITDDLDIVCKELGWDKADVEACGGVTEFMHKHEKHGNTLIF
mmetsp:Transcript_4374/g.8521  ORF Transcript_4374/g.8521 Transcript_4374/m.8521 type:complete len:374 (+) Transcript_4374:231-1352(+)|eukprot:CAMPEP_0178522064 /NCGR_PEP_ID=MMETSP0696-20121128/28327_1 /TAXON_ID=265572 /ORGANISM="Extubocellulus spinifer, Strain CCMP396" /LENGTH=373 /DNA_ID=CAMNT_0020153141 /DNA_START=103 /DNA_END=1224 /DNA_ORIENTATION=+